MSTKVIINSIAKENIWPEKLVHGVWYEAIHKHDALKVLIIVASNNQHVVFVITEKGTHLSITRDTLLSNYQMLREIKQLRITVED